MLKILSTENPNQAEITKQMLESNSINVVMLNKQDSSYLMFGCIELYVQKEQFHKAIKLINQISDESKK
tara:strand:+ start:194 stop:400 length:207 start_codon:yes stop_codon:yes gene_type:complete